jgi:two-component system, NarL family, response regulator DevR
MMLRVAIGDPEPFFADALRDALGPHDIDVVARSVQEPELRTVIGRIKPDIVLTEVRLAIGSGLELARHLAHKTPVLIVTRQDTGDVLLPAVAAGARGCLSHSIDVGELARYVHRAHAGEFVVEEHRLQATLVRAAAGRDARSRGHEADSSAMTIREREVFALLADGCDNAEIAQRLHISFHTVRTHVGRIMRKCEVHSRAELARLAARARGSHAVAVVHVSGPELASG